KSYLNIIPSDKSEKKIREKISTFLHESGHFSPPRVSKGLNTMIRGWLNNYDVPGVSYPAMSKRKLRSYGTI
ncbi:MAG: group II intron maturase-specific domain-containing protein, partial [Chitinophagaceae bacterium]